MLQATYLGHQGWLFDSDGWFVMVDGLLERDFGRGPAGARFPDLWPPRRFSASDFPALHAVVVTHEHEDHFNLPTLNALDRRIPVYLSCRSSRASRTILEEMGFTVRALWPGRKMPLGRLELLPLSPDQIKAPNGDEWDTLGFLVRDIDSGGCFFTNVDTVPTHEMIESVRSASGGASHVLYFRDDHVNWTPIGDLVDGFPTRPPARRISETVAAREWLLNGLDLLVQPGQAIRVSADVLAGLEGVAFLSTLPENTWPPQPPWRCPPGGEYPPASGRTDLTEHDWQQLEGGLRELAQYLYGRTLFRALYSLTPEGLADRKPTFLLLLLADAERNYVALEYDPRSCAFQSVQVTDPVREYVCGLECWGTDLVALLEGQFEPRILSLGRSRQWALDRAAPFDPFRQLMWPFFHPLRRPEACLARYRAIARELPRATWISAATLRAETGA